MIFFNDFKFFESCWCFLKGFAFFYDVFLLLVKSALCVESFMVSAATQMSFLRKRGGHSPGRLFSLSLVYGVNGWITLPLSGAGQPVQKWWLP